MKRPLPLTALMLGIGGLIPFAVFGVQAATADADRAGIALAAYGATILAFLGGVHWGFALLDDAHRHERARFALGIVPSLIGWLALLITVASAVTAGLALLFFGFIATTAVEARAASLGLVPSGYMRLRYGLSTTVIAILGTVTLLRLTGVHILLN